MNRNTGPALSLFSIVLALVAIVLCIVVLTGCTVQAPPVQTTTATKQAVTTIVPPITTETGPAYSTSEDAFLKALEIQGITYSDAQGVIDAGNAACDAMNAGATFEELANVAMTDGDMDAYDAGFFVGAAVSAFCPEYADMIG